MGTREIGFTGGEPFLNKEMVPILEACLARGFKVLVLTNGMNTLLREKAKLEALHQRFTGALTLRISLDHYTPDIHALERGHRSWTPAIESLRWLSDAGIPFAVAGRTMWDEDEASMRAGFRQLFADERINLDAECGEQLVLFPEMDESVDVPEITTACWGILDQDPASMMCASSAWWSNTKAMIISQYKPAPCFHMTRDSTSAPRLRHPGGPLSSTTLTVQNSACWAGAAAQPEFSSEPWHSSLFIQV